MNLLTTLAYHSENAAQCEALLDHLYQLSKSADRKYGHLILAHDANVHAENRERCLIAARLAFTEVYPLEIRSLADPGAPRFLKINNAFRQVSEAVESDYRWPFLWLEPDCTILRPNWHEELVKEYGDQPRPFFGTQMKGMTSGKEFLFMARTGIYSHDTSSRFMSPDLHGPFEFTCANRIVPRMGVTKVFQQLAVTSEADVTKVRDNAVLVHGDKQQILLKGFTPRKTAPAPAPTVTQPAPEAAPQLEEASSNHEPEASVIPIVTENDKPKRKRRTKAEMLAARNGGV